MFINFFRKVFHISRSEYEKTCYFLNNIINVVILILIAGKDKFDKLGFVELEQTLFCGRYLELAETI